MVALFSADRLVAISTRPAFETNLPLLRADIVVILLGELAEGSAIVAEVSRIAGELQVRDQSEGRLDLVHLNRPSGLQLDRSLDEGHDEGLLPRYGSLQMEHCALLKG